MTNRTGKEFRPTATLDEVTGSNHLNVKVEVKMEKVSGGNHSKLTGTDSLSE